jgi:hypothetical protein
LMPSYMFLGPDGFFHLSTLYPRNYTQLVSSTVEHNILVGADASGESARIGRAALVLSFLLPYSKYSNDQRFVSDTFSRNVAAQTEFNYTFAFVELKKDTETVPDVARTFSGSMTDMYSNRGSESLRNIFLYLDNVVIARPQGGSLIYPLTGVRWISPDAGYYYVLRVNYPLAGRNDPLRTRSVKTVLEETYKDIMAACIEGTPGEVRARNGLIEFFNRNEPYTSATQPPKLFTGFKFSRSMPSETAVDDLEDSIKEQYERYYENKFESGFRFTPAPDRAACSEAVRGQGLLVSTAAALNGFFLPDIMKYIEKGNQ